MNRYFVVVAAIAALSVVGCASVEQQSAESKADKTYTTGSRIPTRDGTSSADVKTVGNRDATDDISQRARVGLPTKGAGGM